MAAWNSSSWFIQCRAWAMVTSACPLTAKQRAECRDIGVRRRSYQLTLGDALLAGSPPGREHVVFRVHADDGTYPPRDRQKASWPVTARPQVDDDVSLTVSLRCVRQPLRSRPAE